jgi:hypothetical protein
VTFGELLRASRMRWGQLPYPAKGLMRIRVVPGGSLVELRPLGPVPNERNDGTEFVVWWEKDHGRELVESSPYLRSIATVTEATSVVIDDDGEAVEASA